MKIYSLHLRWVRIISQTLRQREKLMARNYTIETPFIKSEISVADDGQSFSVKYQEKTGYKIGGVMKVGSSPEQYSSKGGTLLYCPSCAALRKCEAVSHRVSSKRNFYTVTHSDIQWFQRARTCRTCFYTFKTAEIQENFLSELIQLRNDIIDGKTISLADLSNYGDNIIPFPGRS